MMAGLTDRLWTFQNLFEELLVSVVTAKRLTWFQFRLRSLFTVMLAAALLCAVASELRQILSRPMSKSGAAPIDPEGLVMPCDQPGHSN